jgi:hypothetical protein
MDDNESDYLTEKDLNLSVEDTEDARETVAMNLNEENGKILKDKLDSILQNNKTQITPQITTNNFRPNIYARSKTMHQRGASLNSNNLDNLKDLNTEENDNKISLQIEPNIQILNELIGDTVEDEDNKISSLSEEESEKENLDLSLSESSRFASHTSEYESNKRKESKGSSSISPAHKQKQIFTPSINTTEQTKQPLTTPNNNNNNGFTEIENKNDISMMSLNKDIDENRNRSYTTFLKRVKTILDTDTSSIKNTTDNINVMQNPNYFNN